MSWWRRRGPAPLDPATIEAVIGGQVALAAELEGEHRQRHRRLTAELARELPLEAVPPIELDEQVRVVVAAIASLVVLEIDPVVLGRMSALVVLPRAMNRRQESSGPVSGVRSAGPRTSIGRTHHGHGPMAVAWPSLAAQARNPRARHNVLIHELAHVIDLADGGGDGVPPVTGELRERWLELIEAEYRRPEPQASDRVLGDYAWSSPLEFWAVASERFFCTPHELAEHKPELYSALTDLYRQDPTQRRPRHG